MTVHKRVVIVGAGFAGLAAARELVGSSFDVTLIDVHDFHTFQPLLYQVATAGLDPADVAFPIRAVFSRAPNVTFHRGRVDRIELALNRVGLLDGSCIDYDALIVATGAAASFLSIRGAAEHSWPLYTLRDARLLRNALLSVLEAADAHPEQYSAAALTFAVIGGGATGVEIAGAIVELVDIGVQHDRLRIDRQRTKIVVLDVADRLLGAFNHRTSRYAAEELLARGIELRLGIGVLAVDEHFVHLADGTSIPVDLTVWAGGITVNGTLAASLPGKRARGERIAVEHNLSIPGYPDIFVVGDAAAVPLGPDASDLAPQLAQVAIQSGRHAAHQLISMTAGVPLTSFVYKDKGMMATIGRRAAVAELKRPWLVRGVVLKGTVGWFAWLALHIVALTGVRNRVVVFLNWSLRYVGWFAGPRIIVEDELPS